MTRSFSITLLIIISLTVCGLFLGCSSQHLLTETAAPTYDKLSPSSTTMISTAQVPHLSRESATSTVIKTPGLSFTPLPTISQDDGDIPTCNNSEHPLLFQKIGQIHGQLLVGDSRGDGLSILTGNSLERITTSLSDLKSNIFLLSPGGKWLLAYPVLSAYAQTLNGGPNPFYLISQDGRIYRKSVNVTGLMRIVHQSWGDSFLFQGLTIRWVNETLLEIIAHYGETGPSFGINGFYDPFQDQWWDKEIEQISSRESDAWLDVSPDLSRIFFIRKKDARVVLWDVQRQVTIWTGNDSPRLPYVRWSHDHSKAALRTSELVIREEKPETIDSLQILSRGGYTVRQIPLPRYEINGQKLLIYDLQWSPDDRQLAISATLYRYDVENHFTQRPILYVYDVDSGKYFYRCLVKSASFAPDILWSPDGRFVLTTSSSLFDLSSKNEYTLGDYNGIGWVEKFSMHWK